MQYISTRGRSPAQSFEQVLLTGLAPDGGLYVPASIPQYSVQEIQSWADLSYADLAFKIISPFVAGAIPENDLKNIIDASYQDFSHCAIAPLTMLGHNQWSLELFHGSTLAFKDFALQLLGRLLDYVLVRKNQHVVILGATSGDTGSAAIEGCRHSKNVELFILHPHQRVSEVQRRQMTTVQGDNLHNLAIKGNFDDCQEIVKAAFNEQSFLPSDRQLVAVNSINWARIMAQIVYYFYASFAVGGPSREVSFSVPTGNFGDIYAGYLAQRMGLPIKQLVIATNKNDILHRFISGNQYSKTSLSHTLSPSMDIMVSSNFERYLFDLFDSDGEKVTAFVSQLSNGALGHKESDNKESDNKEPGNKEPDNKEPGNKELHLDEQQWKKARATFDSYAVDDDATCETIKQVYESCGVLLDPHSAIGVKAAQECNLNPNVPMISVATAHPVKFSEAISKAGLAVPSLPHSMADLLERKETYTVLENSLDKVKAYMLDNI